MSSTAFRGSVPAPVTSGSTWWTSGSGIASTPGITGRICRTCATGPGPTERPGPQRRLQLAEGQHCCDRRFLGDREGRGVPWRGCHPAERDREDGAVTAIEAAGRAGLSGRGRWASRGARRDQVRIGGAGRRPGFEGHRGTGRVRAAAQLGGGRHHPSHSRGAAGYPAGRGLRYFVPLDTRRGAVPLSSALALASRIWHPALRIPRAVGRVVDVASRRVVGPPGGRTGLVVAHL